LDAKTFDRLIAEAAQPSRRGALRFLAAGLLGGLLTSRWVAPAAALQADRDGDGLFDDDETGVYGANPDLYDTDGDGVGDGEEVYVGTDPLTPDLGGATLTGETGEGTAACAALGQSCVVNDCCGGYCDGETCQCASDGGECRGHGECCNGVCNGDGFCGVCGLLGAQCASGADCCAGDYAVGCCWDGVALTSRCTDITNTGFVCPAEAGGETYTERACEPGLVGCGRQCVNLAFDLLHCGACNNLCPSVDGFVGVCSFGVCSLTTPPDRGVPSRDAGIGDCEDVPFPYGCNCVIDGQCAY
jgi:hypothetical protein